jgi:hypothetical protein
VERIEAVEGKEHPPSAYGRESREAAMALLAVLITVLMTVATALLMGHASNARPPMLILLAAVIAPVIVINMAKFWLWGWIHRRYPLSQTYPVSALFFPLIYVITLWTGEARLESAKIVAIILIVGGVALLQAPRDEKPL